MKMIYSIALLTLLLLSNCSETTTTAPQSPAADGLQKPQQPMGAIKIGAARFELYSEALNGKKVGLVVNQTSTVGATHLVDTLLSRGVAVQKIFAPEHGFRGTADAGELVKNGKDTKTNLPIFSLYGDTKKPSAAMIADVDVLVFDIQDVGARFYTYISTMHYIMEAAAENGKQVIVLDRPNPTGHYFDGPVLRPAFKSFVGMHPIPMVHGLTVGELATMINGEGWLKGGKKANLTVVPCENYTHKTPYELPIKPSPNLPNQRAIYLYPSLCLFEGTVVSVGRGTDAPFQVFGHPDFNWGSYAFTPVPTEGAKNPPFNGQTCYGVNLSNLDVKTLQQRETLDLSYLLNAYNNAPQKAKFFNAFFEKLAGTDELRKQIIAGKTEAEIRATWAKDLEQYGKLRQRYLMYAE